MDLKQIGLESVGTVRRNLSSEELTKRAVELGEGRVGMNGALMVDTGKYTGRSPKDRFIVDEPSCRENIWWGDVNRPLSEEVFDRLYSKVLEYYNANEDNAGVLLFDGFSGDDARSYMPVRFIAKKAWQAIFANNMFIRPSNGQLADFSPQFTTINASGMVDDSWEMNGLNSETFIIFHLGKGVAIIGGTEYGGEMKKGIFSIMNYHLPLQGILTMHCAANVDREGENPALFFGLSGTGKTTLSRAILAAAGHAGEVPSPTFTIIETYARTDPPIVHADFYRLDDPSELEEIGLEDYREGAALLAEWPDRAGGFAHEPACLSVELENGGEGRRAIVEGGSAWHGRMP